MNRKVLIIADEWSTLDHSRDSTLHLCKTGIEDFNITIYWAQIDSLYFDQNHFYLKVDGELSLNRNQVELDTSKNSIFNLDAFHSIHLRTDPPVKLSTVQFWNLIESHPIREKFINPPHSLLLWNEKFSTLRFQNWAIPSFFSSKISEIKKYFFENNGQKLLIKSITESASRGVRILSNDWTEAEKMILELQKKSSPWICLQQYDESIDILGETRAIYINGEIVSALNKIPKIPFQVMNLDLPPSDRPTLKITELSAEQKMRSEFIAQSLKKEGIYIASIDFVGPRILEINVTSVGLIQWIDSESKNNSLAKKYWQGLL